MITDKQRLDWLESRVLEVRQHLRYGSRHLFWASPQDDDGEIIKSDIRAQIDNKILEEMGK